MAKIITVSVTLDGPGAGNVAVETHGFQGKGCEAIHNAFSNGGTRKSFKKKPEYNQTQTTANTQRR